MCRNLRKEFSTEVKSKQEKNYYTVYLASTDEVVANGYAYECAEQMNMTLHSFVSMVSKVKSGVNHKYEVFVQKT